MRNGYRVINVDNSVPGDERATAYEQAVTADQTRTVAEVTGDFPTRAFRDALGYFATGVAVITACDEDGQPVGMTISSFNAVSLDPPLVLFSVARDAHSLGAMQQARGFAVNILGREQSDVSTRFARARADKWHAVEHLPGYGGAPVLADVLAHFECMPYARYDGGDHVIFVCRVMRFATSAAGGQPLIFYRGDYLRLDASGQRGNS